MKTTQRLAAGLVHLSKTRKSAGKGCACMFREGSAARGRGETSRRAESSRKAAGKQTERGPRKSERKPRGGRACAAERAEGEGTKGQEICASAPPPHRAKPNGPSRQGHLAPWVTPNQVRVRADLKTGDGICRDPRVALGFGGKGSNATISLLGRKT